MNQADAAPDPDRILFASGLTGTISLAPSSGALQVTGPTNIQAPGPGVLSIDGQRNDRDFYVGAGPGSAVTISGLRMTGGLASSGFPAGGAVASPMGATLTLANDVMTGNRGAFGGGAVAADGKVTIRSSTITGNSASGVTPPGSYGFGGGVFVAEIGAGPSTTLIEASTISGNSANSLGGGAALQGDASVVNSTVFGNTSGNQGGGVLVAGPNYSNEPPTNATLSSSTVSGNTSSRTGGFGQYVPDPANPNPNVPEAVTLSNSVVSNNSASVGADVGGTIRVGFTLIGNRAGATITEQPAGSNLFGVDPQLGPLSSNGGPTQTLAPAPTSPVIDQGLTSLPSDQIGNSRPFEVVGIANAPGGNGADMGAVEDHIPPQFCASSPSTIAGTSQPDNLKGTKAADTVVSRRAADKVRTLAGDDVICAGGGKDRVNGGSGADRILGQFGNDRLVGAAGKDRISGGSGNDLLLTRDGIRDRVRCGPGRDVVKADDKDVVDGGCEHVSRAPASSG